MRRTSCFALLLFVLSACASPSQVPYRDILDLPATAPDQRLVYGNAPQQYAERWQAKDAPRAQLLFVHGGCWSNTFDLSHANPFVSALAERGYTVWSTEYRRTGDPGGGWPGSMQDIVTAVKRIASTSGEPVVLMGHSAGGHLALLAALAVPEHVDAVVGLAAITRPEIYAAGDNSCQRETAAFMSGTPNERPQAYADASLADKALHPVTLLLHGDADRIVPVEQATLPGASTQRVARAGHFDWLHHETRAFKALLKVLADLSSPGIQEPGPE